MHAGYSSNRIPTPIRYLKHPERRIGDVARSGDHCGLANGYVATECSKGEREGI
jgi:hypothetical protein